MSRRPLTSAILPINEPWNPDDLAEELEGNVYYDCNLNFCCSVNEGDLSLPCDERSLAAQVIGAVAVVGAVIYLRRRRAVGKQ